MKYLAISIILEVEFRMNRITCFVGGHCPYSESNSKLYFGSAQIKYLNDQNTSQIAVACAYLYPMLMVQI